MTNNNYLHYQFSVEEIAMLFSMIGEPESGKTVLLQAFGELESGVMEEKLVTASHTLLSREVVSLTNTGSVKLQENIKEVLAPLKTYGNMLQITINDKISDDPEIINIYLGKNQYFTAIRIQLGVVYKLFHGLIKNLTEFVFDSLAFPQSTNMKLFEKGSDQQVAMSQLAEVMDIASESEGLALLINQGLEQELAQALMESVKNAKKRGAVVLTDINSDNYLDKNIDEAGAGFLYLISEENGWIFAFEQATEETMARVMPATRKLAFKEISALLD